MAISDRTRKILWAKAGGRCSICHESLVTDGTEEDDPSVFGQEAHIISAKPDGPRHGYLPDYDRYDNLVLMCSKHHKQVDDQVGQYTVDVLKQTKRDHEAWARGVDSPGPVRLVPDPDYPIPKTLKLFMTGTSLWNFMGDATVFYPSWPDGLREEQEDLIATFIESLTDWRDIASMESGYRVARDAAKSLNENILALAEEGLLVGGRLRHVLLTGGIYAAPTPWRAVDIEIQPLIMARIADERSTPLFPESADGPVTDDDAADVGSP